MSSGLGPAGEAGEKLERIADGELEFSPDDVESYAIRVYREGGQGAGKVEGFEELHEPIRKADFEEIVAREDLERGTYKLYALGGEQRRILGSVWSLETGRPKIGRDDTEERVATIRETESDLGIRRITAPNDWVALLVERALEEDPTTRVDVDEIGDLLTDWMRWHDPPGPDYYAGRLLVRLIEADELELALRLLDSWFEYDGSGGSGKSLADLSTEMEDLNISFGDEMGHDLLEAIVISDTDED